MSKLRGHASQTTVDNVPVWLSGLGHFYNAATLAGIAKAFDTQSYSPPLQLASFFVLTGTVGVIRGRPTALGEEIGRTAWIVGEFGIALTAVSVVMAFVVWTLHKRESGGRRLLLHVSVLP